MFPQARKWKLRRRMMRARADYAAHNQGKSTAKCPHCPAWFFGDTETEAAGQLSRHCVTRHDDPPAVD